jgi:6-phospho-beta-glucosidase
MMERVIIIGGGAASTPTLFRALAADADPRRMHLLLLGRDPTALEAVTAAGRTLLAGTPITLGWSTTLGSGTRESLRGANVVVLQLRVGGYEGRSFDESFPLRHGICGDEGLGPGGLSAAWRAWPTLASYLDTVRRFAPKARVIILSSPVSILVRAAGLCAPDLTVSGICELPWTTLRDVGLQFGIDPHRIEFDYLGVNHIGWFSRLQSGSRDLLEELQQACSSTADFPAPDIIAACRGLPTKYLRLHYERERVLTEQRSRERGRAEFLRDYKRRALEAFRSGDVARIHEALDERPAGWYTHALAPFLLSLAGRPQLVTLFLSGCNEGFDRGMRDDDVLEIPHFSADSRLLRRPNVSPVPETIVGLLRRFVEYERVAARAVMERDPEGLVSALRLHPWTTPADAAERLAREILEAGETAGWRAAGTAPA